MAASSGQTALNIGKARLEKSVPVNGWTSSGMAGEHKVRLQTHSVIRSSYGRLESFKPICKERLSWCTAAILEGCLQGRKKKKNLFPVSKYNIDKQNAHKHQIIITVYRRLPESFYKLPMLATYNM